MNTAHRVCVALTATILVVACSSDSTSPAVRLAGIELRHATRLVYAEGQIRIQAFAYDDRSNWIPVPELEWTSDDSAIASVDERGWVTGHQWGSTTIRASSGGIEGSLRISVRAAVLAIVPDHRLQALMVGESRVLRAEFRGLSGTVLPTPPNVTWSTADRDVVDLAPVSGRDESFVEVTGLATGLAALSVGNGEMSSVEIIGVVPERAPDDAPLRVESFYFFNAASDMFYALIPTMQVSVAPGRTVELMRIEVAVPGMKPNSLPALCSTGTLTAGQHPLLGLTSYPYDDFYGYSYAPVSASEGAALLTYRTDDGRVIRTVAYGPLDVWGYGTGYATRFPWKLCNS